MIIFGYIQLHNIIDIESLAKPLEYDNSTALPADASVFHQLLAVCSLKIASVRRKFPMFQKFRWK